jgi:hypothetical protein
MRWRRSRRRSAGSGHAEQSGAGAGVAGESGAELTASARERLDVVG